MKILGYDVPLGMSVTNYAPESIAAFKDAGFTCFEVGIFMPFLKIEEERDPTVEEAAWMGRRGEEEQRVALKQPLLDAIGNVWSIHLPFGWGWDISHICEEERSSVCEAMKRLIDLTAQWHPKVYVIHPSRGPVIENRQIRLAHSVRSLHELDTYAQRYGARVAVEDLPRQGLGNTTIEMRAMMLAANVPVCFDVNHLLKDSHESFIDAMGTNVITTHLSDYDRIDEKHWLPGDGVVPWREVFFGLLKKGYKGPYLFEIKPGPNGLYSPLETISAFLKALGD